MIMGIPSLNIEVGEVSFWGILLGGGGLDGWLKRVARSGFLARVAWFYRVQSMENYSYNLTVHLVNAYIHI